MAINCIKVSGSKVCIMYLMKNFCFAATKWITTKNNNSKDTATKLKKKQNRAIIK